MPPELSSITREITYLSACAVASIHYLTVTHYLAATTGTPLFVAHTCPLRSSGFKHDYQQMTIPQVPVRQFITVTNSSIALRKFRSRSYHVCTAQELGIK
jgi:hypothetical protein